MQDHQEQNVASTSKTKNLHLFAELSKMYKGQLLTALASKF